MVFHILKKFSSKEKQTVSTNYVSLQSTLAELFQKKIREEAIKKEEEESTFSRAAESTVNNHG
jgi:hypothetical protein